jgi:hypothetical protein
VFGWSDEHLHQFLIQKKPYRIGSIGGIIFDDNPRQVRLRDFHFRLKETWLSEYDLTDWWQHELRLEQVLPFAAFSTVRLFACWRGASDRSGSNQEKPGSQHPFFMLAQ